MSAQQSSTSTTPIEPALQKMLLFVIRSLAERPEDVQVDYISEPDGTVFRVRANPADMGRLIGKNGQTARALRVIVNASGVKNGCRFDLDIDGNETEQTRRSRY